MSNTGQEDLQLRLRFHYNALINIDFKTGLLINVNNTKLLNISVTIVSLNIISNLFLGIYINLVQFFIIDEIDTFEMGLAQCILLKLGINLNMVVVFDEISAEYGKADESQIRLCRYLHA